jgi:hypothetical protein
MFWYLRILKINQIIICFIWIISNLLWGWGIFIVWSVRRVSLATRKLVDINIVRSILSFIVFEFFRWNNCLICLHFILLFLFIFAPVYLFWLKTIVLESIFIFLNCISLRNDVLLAIIDFKLELMTLANWN